MVSWEDEPFGFSGSLKSTTDEDVCMMKCIVERGFKSERLIDSIMLAILEYAAEVGLTGRRLTTAEGALISSWAIFPVRSRTLEDWV